MFIDGTDRKGSAYLEFQYNDIEEPFKKIQLNKIQHFKDSSLLLSDDKLDNFLNIYYEFFKDCTSLDGSDNFCHYGLNFYSKELTKKLYNTIKSKNIFGSERLLLWLSEAFTSHKGFYILGI